MKSVLLKGGPVGLHRVHHVEGGELPGKVTVAYYGLHVHFVPSGEVEVVDGEELPVFRFSYSTTIAE
ncbi:DUF5988 family protein [Streptomyces olivoreticuli]|uniref:DUF5988 family protein n=1 Tax=Streptomyces olivoreticuli TaxID=68246 RepID=UPI00265849DB|nr:DUF5988 family protein [Streptomyces olivoreticuli]WKK21939.1 DUF5988 family protein [Streptomyces olivoreticuli]WKK26914.1 DUF5988 family protein [Streptomyces olivoreticuli]